MNVQLLNNPSYVPYEPNEREKHQTIKNNDSPHTKDCCMQTLQAEKRSDKGGKLITFAQRKTENKLTEKKANESLHLHKNNQTNVIPPSNYFTRTTECIRNFTGKLMSRGDYQPQTYANEPSKMEYNEEHAAREYKTSKPRKRTKCGRCQSNLDSHAMEYLPVKSLCFRCHYVK